MSNGNGVPNFIRLKPLDPKNDLKTVIRAEDVSSYQLYAWSKNFESSEIVTTNTTKVILRNGSSYVSNETIEEFEIRLNYAINQYIVD